MYSENSSLSTGANVLTALAGKVLKMLAGKPLIWHIVDRLRHCKLISSVIIVTSTDASDDELVEYCIDNRWEYFRGDLNDVLSRYLSALESLDCEYFLRITGDSPLVYPALIDRQIVSVQTCCADVCYVSPLLQTFGGQSVHSLGSVKYIQRHSKNALDNEHMGSIYLSDNPSEFRTARLLLTADLCRFDYRVTIDYPSDYEKINRLYSELWRGCSIDMREALEWLENYEISNEKIESNVISTGKSIPHTSLLLDSVLPDVEQTFAWDSDIFKVLEL